MKIKNVFLLLLIAVMFSIIGLSINTVIEHTKEAQGYLASGTRKTIQKKLVWRTSTDGTGDIYAADTTGWLTVNGTNVYYSDPIDVSTSEYLGAYYELNEGTSTGHVSLDFQSGIYSIPGDRTSAIKWGDAVSLVSDFQTDDDTESESITSNLGEVSRFITTGETNNATNTQFMVKFVDQ